ncbi:MAG: hypothetical protein JXB24_11135 [Bacteroidales bacterium]|nr:hypothetical protein [Bacteroidales bacterium]
MECKKDTNLSFCNCTFSCSKKGTCCDCIHYHRSLGELPACYFPNDVESSGDRSIERFVSLVQQRGAWW